MLRQRNIPYELTILLIFLLQALISCQDDRFTSTKSGLKYKIVREGPGPSFVQGNYVFLNMDYFDENDSLLFTYSTKNIPVTLQYNDTIWDVSGQIYEGLKLLKVGDSAIFKVNCANLYEVSFRGSIPYGLNPYSEITFRIGVERTSTPEEFVLWQKNLISSREKELELRIKDQLLNDLSRIDQYLEIQHITALETESGLRYIVHKKGTGRKPIKGDRVRVTYTGKLLDGTVFDSSAKHGEPYKFIIGYGNVIAGWDEGVSLMSKGARYTFYIPSALAYGTKGLGDTIKPNSVLIFDVELLDIQKQ